MAVIFQETITTQAGGDYSTGFCSYSEAINYPSLKITFNGVSYDCPKNEVSGPEGSMYVYGGFSSQGPDFTDYPFGLMSDPSLPANTFFTETAGTYTVKVENIPLVNKVVFGNETLIDLTSDTVTASVLAEGYTAHDRSGAPIVGNAPASPSFPTFTYQRMGEISATNCDKTWEECYNASTNMAYLVYNDGNVVMQMVGQRYALANDSITYVFFRGGIPVSSLIYYSDGSIVYTNSSPTVTTTNITSNGTYTAPTNTVWDEVTVTVSGGGSPSLQTKTKSYTPTESAQTETVTADSGYDGLSSVSVSVGAISNTYVGTGITRRSSSDLTSSGATVTVPSGYYSAQASKSVASGTAGTPTATKGTVSNHSISVTPKVTNTAGYISGGTKTGTAVTVSASELVSGSQTITSNQTVDVTNLASVVVAVPIVTYYTGSSNPPSSTGSNGDIYLKVVS